MGLIRLLRLWIMLLRVVELGPATRRAVGQFGAAVEAVTPRKRREETGTIVSVTRAGNERVIAARVRVGDQLVDVPWNGAGAREGDVVMLSRALGSAAAPDWTFERFADSLSAYPVADDSADIPPPLFVNPFVTTTMLTAAAQQGAQVTVHLTETPAAYGPASIEVQWRRTGTGESWRRLVIADQAGVDAAIQAVLPELLEPGAGYDFRARTTTLGGATSPYGDLLTRTLEPAIAAPAQPPPFTTAPAIPYIDVSGNVEMVIHYPPPNQPTIYDYWQTEIATAAGGPTGWTMQHYGAIGNFIAPSAGNYYVRYREVSKYSSGGARVASPWQPTSGWAGPFVLTAGAAGVDVMPPPVPNPPSLTTGAGLRAGAFTVWIDVNVPTYVEPSPQPPDFAVIVYNLWEDTGGLASAESVNPLHPTHFIGLKPATTYYCMAAARDRTGNQSAFSNPVSYITTPAVQAPVGVPSIALTMGYNKAALILNWPGEPGITANGFHLWGTPDAGNAGATYYIGFVPATPADDTGRLYCIHVVAPVTSDPYPGRPKLAGTAWGFMAAAGTSVGVVGPACAWSVGVFTEIDGQNLIGQSITGDKFNANVVLATQRIELAGSAYLHDTSNNIRAKADGFYAGWNTYPTNYVYLGAGGLRSVGTATDYYVAGSASSGGSGWRGTFKATTYVNPGEGPTGLTYRGVDAKLAGQTEWGNDVGWMIDNQGLGFYNVNWPMTGQDDAYYGIGGMTRTVRGLGRARAGALIPIPASVSSGTWGAFAAHTDYALTPNTYSAYIPTSGVIAWVVRGFFNAPAGTRLYLVSNPAAWSYESGGSAVVPAGATAVDFGPWIISAIQAQTIVSRWTAAGTGGQFWFTGYFI